MYKVKILSVDDDLDILDVIEATLEDDYDISKATSREETLQKIKNINPDLIILDYNLPDGTGPEIAQTLRRDPVFIHTPILMLTGRGEVEDKVLGLESGVDDYMVKPFSPEELMARVKMLINRSNIHLDANPLTRLPGNITITKELEKRIQSQTKFAILYFDLDHFKAINDHYGFERGDECIKRVGRLLIDILHRQGSPTDFIGHIGGDDFVMISVPEKAEIIAKAAISEFDTIAPQFFNDSDRIRGYIETKDRDGSIKKFSFPTISIGIISNQNRNFSHVAEISAIGAELKEAAKKIDKSAFVSDRRVAED